MFTEMSAVTGLHRKSLIRLLRGPALERTSRKPRVRRRHYGAAVADVVMVVWESLDYVCAERLRPVLLQTAQQLDRREELVLTDEAADHHQPGYGAAAAAALPTGSAQATPAQAPATQPITAPGANGTHLPPDYGSEFFNHHLLRYFGREISGLKLSRSRPYRKNDNRFVEQKYSTLVRAYLGYQRYQRLETAGQWVALNALCASTNPRQLRGEIYQAVERLSQSPFSLITNNQKEAALLQ